MKYDLDKIIEIEYLKRKNEFLRKFIILSLLFFLVILVFLYLYLITNKTSELYQTRDWLNKIKPEYLGLVHNITFTTDNNLMFNLTNNSNTVGLNYNKGDYIIIYLTGDYNEDFNTLKHEIAHSFVDTGNFDLNEKIVQEIASTDLEVKKF